MEESILSSQAVFSIGEFVVTRTVVTTWLIMGALGALAWLATRHMSEEPGKLQTVLEGIVSVIDDTIRSVAERQAQQLLPFIGTLWIFLVFANLSGLIPGVESPTRDLSATAALAILVFLSTHWFGIRAQGLRNYLRHYLSPNPVLLPFHVMSEITRTIALAVRLFGNIMSLELAALLVLLVVGFLAPVPILMLHIVEALVQAYIFGTLALVYVAGGLQSQELHTTPAKEQE